MTTTKLTSKEVHEIAPTYCKLSEEQGEVIMGGLQIPYPAPDGFPSDHEMEREAEAKFGAVALSRVGPDDDDETITYIAVRK